MSMHMKAEGWCVVHTQPWKERLVGGLLDELPDHEVYLPEVLQQSRGHCQLMPLFPGYLFVRGGANGPETSYIHRTPGVIRLVTFDTRPAQTPASIVAALRQQVDAINEQGGLATHPFHEGQRVRITAGPMQGLEALFVGPMQPSRRVSVLLDFLGRLQKVQVEVTDLESVHRHPPRRTRGAGRRIRAGL